MDELHEQWNTYRIGHLLIHIVKEWIIECAVIWRGYKRDAGYGEKEAEETQYYPGAGEHGGYTSGSGVPRRSDAYHLTRRLRFFLRKKVNFIWFKSRGILVSFLYSLMCLFSLKQTLADLGDVPLWAKNVFIFMQEKLVK